MAEPQPVVALRTFGGLRVLDAEGRDVPLPDRLSVVLAALVAARGRTVARGELVDLIWAEDPPGSAVNQLHRYVGALRRSLEPGLGMRNGGSLVERHGDGYRFRAEHLDVDLDRFDLLVARGRAAFADGAPSVAVELLLEAMEVAALPPLSDVGARITRSADVAAVERERIAAAVLLAMAALQSSDPERALPLTARVAAQAPLDEVLQAGMIRLLTAAGRSAEALAHHAVVTEHLRETLGADPGPALQAAHHDALAAGSAPTAPVKRSWVSNLPPANPAYIDPPGLAGRLPQLDSGLPNGTITVISGGGGIGKTTLAVHLARTMERGSGASSVFVDLRGFDPEQAALGPAAAVGAVLDQLEVEHTGLAPDVEERLLRSTVRDRPVIAVLDSARDADQLRPLLGCLSGSTIIVTTRSLLQTLVVREGARLVQLDRWDEGAAYELLAERLGVETGEQPDPALTAIARACAGLPLALSIAAARCATVRPDRWPGIAQELSDSAHALDALSAGAADDVRSVFATSLRGLDEDTVTVFRRAALVPAASAAAGAIAAVSGTDAERTARALRLLVESSLLGDDGDDRFSMHDLVRSYALELMGPEERSGVQSAALSYVADTAALIWATTGRPAIGSHRPPRFERQTLPALADFAAGRVWARRNMEWIEALDATGEQVGRRAEVLGIGLHLRPVRGGDRPIAESIERFQRLERFAIELDEPGSLAEVRSSLGFYLGAAGQNEEARSAYLAAIDLFERVGDVGGIAKTYRNLTADAARLHRFDDADRFAEQAVAFADASGNASLMVSCG